MSCVECVQLLFYCRVFVGSFSLFAAFLTLSPASSMGSSCDASGKVGFKLCFPPSSPAERDPGSTTLRTEASTVCDVGSCSGCITDLSAGNLKGRGGRLETVARQSAAARRDQLSSGHGTESNSRLVWTFSLYVDRSGHSRVESCLRSVVCFFAGVEYLFILTVRF